MKKNLFILILFVAAFANSQDLQIKLQLDQAANQTVKLAHHYLGNIYIDDSLQLNTGGAGTFNRDTLLPQGLYKIYLDENNHFDFLLGADQQFSITNATFNANSVLIEGSSESEEFFKYIAFLGNLRAKSEELRKKVETASPNEKQELQEELKKLTPELHQYWFRIKEEFPDAFLSKFLLANYVPELDISTLPEDIQKNDSLVLLERFYFQQKHFWDYFDYTDERFLYTPFYKPKLETWFTKVLFQNYDSVQQPVFKFIEDVRPNKRIFQFVTSWFLNSTINSNILGMDALFVDLARTYYLSGEAFWTNAETMKNIRENVIFIEQNLIGKTAPDLTLETIDGEFVNLHKINAKITVVLIYEPNCSHCKEFVPKFYTDVYQKFKNKGLEVYAIYSMDDKEEWAEFLTKHGLYEWINVWDEDNSSNFKISYDARKTPAIYVLDEAKTIIAKKLTVEQLIDLFSKRLN